MTMDNKAFVMFLKTIGILIAMASGASADAATNGNISFTTNHIYVKEKLYEEAVFSLKREGGKSGLIFLACKILNSTSTTDFVDISSGASFQDGVTSSSCVFTVVDDNIPEPNITYSVGITILSGGAVTSSIAYVTILGNDDPYGSIAFQNAGQIITINEPLQSQQAVASLNITRSKGTIGQITVFWQVSAGLTSAMKDLSPTSGRVIFENGERLKTISIFVLPDNIPEKEEQFSIQLMNVTEGAKINSTAKSVELRIPANDPPVQFSTSSLAASEQQTLSVTVNRGIIQGEQIGSVLGMTTVNYATVDGTAKAGVDYQSTSGILTFNSGDTSKTINVPILKDPHPEIMENFTVVLSNPSSDSILGTPSTLVVNIAKNDDPHGVVSFKSLNMDNTSNTILNEDGISSSVLQVNRSRGTFGTISLQWRVVPGIKSPDVIPSNVLNQSSGSLIFQTGVSMQQITLSLKLDKVPSEAKELYVELVNVTGGARLASSSSSFPRARVIVRDSDNAYGVINFGNQSEHKVVLSSTPRRVLVSVRRSGGTLAPIKINYTAVYLLPGSSVPSSDAQLIYPGTITMPTGAKNTTIVIQVAENSFLKNGAVILVTLSSVQLEKSTIIAPLSPLIGGVGTVYVNITSGLANGEIAFFNSPISMVVNEPSTNMPSSNVSLPLMRDGTAKQATVFWRITPVTNTFTSADASPWTGFVVFLPGSDRMNISINIHPDNIPELDESFIVELTNVTEKNEKLRTGATRANVMIRKNDNPGGRFEFNFTGSLVLQENQLYTLDIIRSGGSLTTQRVKVEIMNGRNDFTAYQSILKFNPNENKKMFFVYPTDDSIPEINETFEIVLTSIEDSVLGSRTVVNVTILQNDDTNGVFSFLNSPSNLNKLAVEMKGSYRTVSFDVIRDRGSFGLVSIFWNVTSLTNHHPSFDIQPLSGKVDFANGTSSKALDITIKPDNIPEGEEKFQISLLNATGGGKLKTPLQAMLTINANDAPIYFLHATTVKVQEGQIANLTIVMNRTLSTNIVVTYSTTDMTASASSGDYSGFTNRSVTLLAGETRKNISIQTINDLVPEISETFKVRLIASDGDTVLIHPMEATVTIEPNDVPYGVFQFAASALYKTASEGDTVSFEVQRTAGLFANVTVSYDVISSTRMPVTDNTEFINAKGNLIFKQGSSKENLNLQIRKDSVPELNETFYVRITNISGDFAISNGWRLGNRTEAVLLVLPSDDPFGVLNFAASSLQISVAEDYQPGMINATYANLTVERSKGSFGSVQAVWQLYKASSVPNLPARIWDLVFHSQRGNYVIEISGRNYSGTPGFNFSSSNASYLYISQQELPASSLLSDGFSLSMWLKPIRSYNGTIMSKHEDVTNLPILVLGLNSNESFSEIFVQVSSDKYTVPVSTSKDLFDGRWHSLIFTFSTSKLSIFADGREISSKTLLNSVKTSSGYIYIGCNSPSHSHFTGALQDVRLYTKVLISAHITEISSIAKVMTPIDGYLNFGNLVTKQNIFLRTIDNSIPEEDAVYSLRLIDVKGGGKLGTPSDTSSRVTILKSDNANGQFAFTSSKCSIVAMENKTSLSFVVQRTIGSFGSVTVNWEIRKLVAGKPLATADFTSSTGNVVFAVGQNQETIIVNPVDDAIPELEENFELRLVSAIPADGAAASSPSSGATIKANFDRCNISLVANDNPFGLLQISPNRPTAAIAPMAAPLNVTIREEAGNITLYVVRAQGLTGTVSCEWKTNPVSARGNIDFAQSVGSLTFAAGVNATKLSVVIIDNNKPEIEKTFRVQLYNPTGGAVLGLASSINVIILPSDDAFGVFGFANASKLITANEEVGSVSVTIKRTGGLLGAVNVTWRLLNGSADFDMQEGVVMFGKGQSERRFAIPVKDDTIPELSEQFTLELFNVSRGRIAPRNRTMEIKIIANDDPYGVFELSPSPQRVVEGNKTVSLMVSRQGGLIGRVRVFYQTVRISTARPGLDYIEVSGNVVFENGQKTATINVTILDDKDPEPDERLLVNLTTVALISGTEVVASSPKIGNNRLATIIINANDNANGILQFSLSSVTVHEGASGTFLNLTRIGGAFGQVSVRFEITNSVATIGLDYSVSSFEIVMTADQTSAAVPISIIDDNIPEFAESLVVNLIDSSVTGGASIGSPKQCIITIAENDYPYGLIGFASGSLNKSVQEPESGSSPVTLTVMRNGGTTGTVQVDWNATLNGHLASSDLTQSRGNIIFLSGERKQDFTISLLSDDVPEDNEAVKINLGYVSNGKAIIDNSTRTATVNILPNDDPYGVIQFASSQFTTQESAANTQIFLNVTRTKGLFGSVKIYYSTKTASLASNQASSSSDYESSTEKSIQLGPGIAFGQIPITILSDNVPELDEQFLVQITKAETIGIVPMRSVNTGRPNVMNVTIAANDQPYGLFSINIEDTGTEGRTFAIVEPESGQTSINFKIKRTQGLLGSVSVSWRVGSRSTVNTTTDVSGVSGGRFDFNQNEAEKSFNVAVKSDEIPETDEYLVIELYNPLGGALINQQKKEVTLTIKANDGVGGNIGFSSGSRSKTAKEGEQVTFSVYRTLPAAGNVTLNWTIEGTNASLDFVSTTGKIFIPQGLAESFLVITTKHDSTPEKNEQFILRISDPVTVGISSTGAATLVSGDATATIIIGASNEPHGIVEFAQGAQPIKVKENSGRISLRLVRNMGNIGEVIIRYKMQGIKVNETTTAAMEVQDFQSNENHSVIIADGNDSGSIFVEIINDDTPERDEAFFVNLTSVQLRDGGNVTAPPKIGLLRSMQILIEANDGTQGELAFAPNFERITVREEVKSFNITVVRYKGSFGDVYAFYNLNRLTATESDFFIAGGVMNGPAKLTFANGQRERNITVLIKNDNITEPKEQFEIGLTIQNAVNNGGVTIGNISKSLVTIAANDDANGVISFAARSQMRAINEPETASSGNMTATFVIERKVGTYGVVNVRWNIIGVNSSTDVSPVNGLVTFFANDREKEFRISALQDNVPELDKKYTIQITVLSGGARLGSSSKATLIIAASDDPNGLFRIRSYPSLTRSLNIEESARSINTIVQRTGGSIGKVFIQYETKQGSAIAGSGITLYFGFDQILKTRSAESFHSFSANGEMYLLLASSYRKEHPGSIPTTNVLQQPYQSTLFRWQGVFVPLMTLLTDGAVKWKSFDILNQPYLIAVNYGTAGRHETFSQIFKFHSNNTLELIQNITTKGAADAIFFISNGEFFLMIANKEDNSGKSNLQTQLLKWQGTQFVLESSGLSTSGASSLVSFTINNLMYVVVANGYDSAGSTDSTASSVYLWSPINKRFTLSQSIQTQGARDVDFINIGGESYLFLTNFKSASRLYKYKSTSPSGFLEVQQLNIANARTGIFFSWNQTVFLVVAANQSVLFKWDANSKLFQNLTNLPVKNAVSIVPFNATDSVSGIAQYLAVAVFDSMESYVLRLAMLSGNADYVSRRGELTFYEGQSSLKLDFTILKDSLPEMDEGFAINLLNPRGGAKLAANPNLQVNILSNDNAYGRLAFSDASLRVNVTEKQWDSVLKLDLVREFGSFGQVSVNWNISSLAGHVITDLYPTSGQINLNQGISSGSILIYVKADGIPELNEQFRVSLTSVAITGAPNSNRGPTINYLKNVAMVTLLANNDPHGVIEWKNQIEVTTEETEVNSSALLVISRQFGTLGDIVISYETIQASKVAANERVAIPGVDYFSKKSTILMKQGAREALVYVKVRHDNNTSVNEIFFVNITKVSLASGTVVPNSPRIKAGKNQVEVVITEAVLNRGTVEFASSNMIRIEESVGLLQLPLIRVNGSAGTIGVHFKVSGINASSADFSPQEGIVTFSNSSTRANLNITIINDAIAELNEVFNVKLTKPAGGAKLGARKTIEVLISENDYPYGLFSFNPVSRQVANATEGSTIYLNVDRKQGVFRSINVQWSCSARAQNDLLPWSGTVVFAENVTRAVITIGVINDSVPEIDETFTCTLMAANNGGVISLEKTANITVIANDKPHGVISVDLKSRTFAVGEPISSGYNGQFFVMLRRSVGFDGRVEVNWRMKSVSGMENSVDTFNATSGKVIFPAGIAMQRINLQVKDDSTPEESKLYLLSLDSITGGAELDVSVNATKCFITVVASEQPYGTIQFQPPLSMNVSESSGYVYLTLLRSGGLIGRLRVNYTTSSTTAVPGLDFFPSSGEVFFNPGESMKSMKFDIINDTQPELTEMFKVNLTEVHLVTPRKMNYNIVNGLQVDVPPKIGSQSLVEVSINENDEPYGAIEFTQTARLVHERDGRISVAVNRTGGSYGSSTVAYTYTSMNASNPDDFVVSSSSLTFSQGELQKFITVDIIDDKISEFQESFSLDLTSITGKAKLGSKRKIIITIETSDNPYGLFGIFNTSLSVSIANPVTSQSLSFPLSRIDGALKRSEVYWRVVRTVQSPSSITEDIVPGLGTLVFEANERGPKLINITILSFGGLQEPEETFTLSVYNASGGAALDHSAVNVAIKVLKKGHPNGLFSMEGVVSPSSNVDEPQNGILNVKIPVVRKEGNTGLIHVRWMISSSTGSIGQDIRIGNKTLIFNNGEMKKNIIINVTSDDLPELDEVYKVILLSADNGAEINSVGNAINFTVKANDYPHGLFQMSETGKRFQFNAASLVRALNFTVERKNGTIGSVQADLVLRYSADGKTDKKSVTFATGQNKVQTSFSFPSGRFIMFGSNFTIQLQSVKLLSAGSSMPPAVDSASPSIVINIPEEAANSIVEFDANSRMLSSSESFDVSNVIVSRRGLFGAISVNWRSGYPAGSFKSGSINPALGSLSFVQGERSKSFSFRASIPSVLESNTIYAVYLSSVSLGQGQPAWPKIGAFNSAVVDAHGVLEIAQSHRSVSVMEGSKASVQIRRLLSTMAKIRVHYTTQKYPGATAAVENVDYTPVTSYVDFSQGQTTAIIQINTIEDSNAIPERDELFYVQLTSVEVIPSSSRLSSSSPRISTNNRSTITIRDNDSPFGVISFTSRSNQITTQESIGQVTLNLKRTGGVFSSVTVLVRSIGGGEPWQADVLNSLPSNSPIKSAIAARSTAASVLQPNRDYVPLNQKITFPELNSIPAGGQIKSVNLSILQDSMSEPAEQLIVVITNTTGGARLPTIAENMQAYSVVTIEGNGLWNGEVGFTIKKSSVDEDKSAQVTIPLQRNKGSAELIEVKWNAWSPNGNLADQLIHVSGNTSFAAGKSTSSITVQLKNDSIPEFASWFFVNLTTNANGAIIAGPLSSLSSYCNVTMSESDYPAGRIGFDSSYRFPVFDFGNTFEQLRVRRYDGALKDVTVRYTTVSLTTVINEGGVIMTPAIESKDYTAAAGILSFPKGIKVASIDLKLTPGTASAGAYPKVFNVTLFSPTNGAILYESYKYEQITIAKEAQTKIFLKLRSNALKRPLTDAEIEYIFGQTLVQVKRPPLNEKSQYLIMRTIRLITAYKLTLPTGNKALTKNSKNLLLDIFDSLLSTSRTDTRGKSAWAVLLDELAYNFLTELKCPSSFTGTKTNFALTSKRDQGKQLNGVKFAGKNSDFFRYPVNMFSTTSSACTDLHFIDYGNQQFFSSGKAVLNNKVMSSAIKSGLSSGMKIVFRVHTSKTRVSRTGVSCVIWNHATAGVKGDWSSKNCKVTTPHQGDAQTQTYVECECQHLSQYAVLALSDSRTGYEIYFFVSCFLCMSACFLTLIAHLCVPDKTIVANLLMHMIFSIMMTNILYVVGAYISPSLTSKPTNCGILGLAIHYFFIAQFSWMFAQAYNLWRILVINDENTHRKYVQFFLIGWGIPVILTAGYVFVTVVAYKWSFSDMYGDMHKNGDMCFIPNAYAAFGSAFVPALLIILGVAIVWVQSYQVKPQWKCYDDIYRGRYNYKELRYLLILFCLLIITWLFGGLHLALGDLWLIATFSAFNILLGLYILVQYAVLRNEMMHRCRGKYALHTDPSLLSNHELIYAPESLNLNTRKLIDTQSNQSNRLSDWEDIELPVNLEPIDMPDKGRILDSAQSARLRGHVNESYDDDMESDEFDDLIFALKTGRGMSPSIQEEQELSEKPVTPRPTSTDQVNIRRIKIADTHL